MCFFFFFVAAHTLPVTSAFFMLLFSTHNVSCPIRNPYGTVDGHNFALDDVKCTGSESSLEDCKHLTKENCNAWETVGVACTGELPLSDPVFPKWIWEY